MSHWSRRDVLRASAGAAAVAVPIAALSGGVAGASSGPSAESANGPEAGGLEQLDAEASGPVMFMVRDAASGTVTILHGEHQVVVKDRKLVAQVMRAAKVNGRVR